MGKKGDFNDINDISEVKINYPKMLKTIKTLDHATLKFACVLLCDRGEYVEKQLNWIKDVLSNKNIDSDMKVLCIAIYQTKMKQSSNPEQGFWCSPEELAERTALSVDHVEELLSLLHESNLLTHLDPPQE
jgi:hypothetical protein